jgi:hypothetical protein
LQTLLVLILWPFYLVRGCVVCAFGVTLIMFNSIIDLWAGHPEGRNPARRKPL